MHSLLMDYVRVEGWRELSIEEAGALARYLPGRRNSREAASQQITPPSTARVENHSGRRSVWHEFDPVAEDSEFADHFARPRLPRLFSDGRTTFFVSNSLVKNLPDQATEPMGDRPDGLCVSQSRDEAAVHDREDRAFGLHGGVGRLIQDASHLAVALRAAVTVVHAGAFLVARAGAHPGGEVFGRRERRGGGADFRNDLLRGISAQARYLGEPMHRIMMFSKEVRHLLIELAEVVLDQSQFFQREP